MATATIIAGRKQEGQYGYTYGSRLVERKGKHYLVQDEFCGMDSPEGGCPREFVYAVPAERVQEVSTLFAEADEFVDDNRPELGTNWHYFQQVVLPGLRCYGRASGLSWASEL